MINPREYRSRKATHVHVKIRLIKHGRKPTPEESAEALAFVRLNGRAPDGWELPDTVLINWEHPKSGGESDDVRELQQFGELIKEMDAENELQFSIVRR